MKFQRFDPAQVPELMAWFADAAAASHLGRAGFPLSVHGGELPRGFQGRQHRQLLARLRGRFARRLRAVLPARRALPFRARRRLAALARPGSRHAPVPGDGRLGPRRVRAARALAVRGQGQHRRAPAVPAPRFPRSRRIRRRCRKAWMRTTWLRVSCWVRPPRGKIRSRCNSPKSAAWRWRCWEPRSPRTTATPPSACAAASTRPRPWKAARCTSSWTRRTATAWSDFDPKRTSKLGLGPEDRRPARRPRPREAGGRA